MSVSSTPEWKPPPKRKPRLRTWMIIAGIVVVLFGGAAIVGLVKGGDDSENRPVPVECAL